MEGSELLVNTTFGDARKGYDKAQVDEFLRALSGKWGELEALLRQATQRAEEAEARARQAEDRHHESALALADAQRRCAELDEALGEARAELNRDEVEVATGVLGMAQRTAEQTVADAEARAAQLVADAEVRASVTMLDAEQRAERLARETEAELEELRRARLDGIEADVERLGGQRDSLAAEVADLEAYVDGQRRRVRAAVEEIGRALAEDGPLALEDHPVLSTLPVRVRPSGDDGDAAGAPPDADESVADEPASTGEETAAWDVLADDATAVPAAAADPGYASPETADADAGDRVGAWRASPIPDLLEGPGAPLIDLSDAVPPRDPAPLDAADLPVDAMRWDDDEDLDVMARFTDDAAPGEGHAGDETSPLGAPHPEADAAMDEFFAEEAAGRRRGRRRR